MFKSKIYLNNFRAIARALAAGREVWCEETGEGVCHHDGISPLYKAAGCPLNMAKHIARNFIEMIGEEGSTFFMWDK